LIERIDAWNLQRDEGEFTERKMMMTGGLVKRIVGYGRIIDELLIL
jgi:hypothetical protein